MNDTVDALTSPTLKNLREHWWDDAFTEFLAETLRPRPGNRILDVGCGEGLAEVAIGRLQVSQVRLVGVDLVPAKAAAAKRVTESHNQRVSFAAGDAARLPFKDGSFDSTFCVAVLQHVAQVAGAAAEISRVTAPGGRVVIVEPDNAARYTYSSLPSGMRAFAEAARLLRGPGRRARRGDRSVDRPQDGHDAGRRPHRAAGRASLPGVARPAGLPARRGVGGAPGAGRTGAWPRARRRRCVPAARRISTRSTPTGTNRARRPSAASRFSTPRSLPPLAKRKSNGGSRLPASGFRKSHGPRRPEGHDGWDDYAPFYDWENARTLGRRDLPFWRTVARQVGGPVLELGLRHRAACRFRWLVPACRLSASTARSRCSCARAGARRAPGSRRGCRSSAATSGSCRLPSAARRAAPFAMVLAPYGMLQSLLRERDLMATLAAAHRVLEPGGTLGIELVADLPSWAEYKKRVSLSGWRGRKGGARVSLVESVRQDRARRLTIFDQEFTERRGRSKAVRTFSLAFRTLSVPQMVRRLEKSGFEISALLGDYKGRAWDARADVWVILAKKPVGRWSFESQLGRRLEAGARG